VIFTTTFPSQHSKYGRPSVPRSFYRHSREFFPRGCGCSCRNWIDPPSPHCRDSALRCPDVAAPRPYLAQVKSAVHVEHVSSNVTSHWRRQEQRGIDNLVSFTQAAERDLFNKVLRHFLRHSFAHSDIDESRRNGVHGYVLPRKLAC